MASLSEAKAMGGIGSILVLLTPIPSVGWLLGIIGLILTLIAIKYISDSVGDRRIFNNMIYSVILGVVAIAVAAITVIAAFYRLMGMGTFVGSQFMIGQNITPGDWIGFGLTVIPGLIAIWAVMIASAFFLRRSYSSIATNLNVGIFDTGAIIYLIGAILMVVLIGVLLILVAEILFAVGFFSIHERTPEPRPVQPA